MTLQYISLALILLLAVWVVLVFNQHVGHRNRMREGWSGVEVQLKRRHDLIPRLVKAVSAYGHHERSTLEGVMEKRAGALAAKGAGEAADAERGLGEGVGNIIKVAEDYPDIKADAVFRDLMTELVATEDEIQYARRYYNGAVRELNNAIGVFPANIVAGIFGFKEGDFFEVEKATEREAPMVSLSVADED
ncbi:MAG: LemA family protein [Akkermansiaceae bacterium]|jgi:LemA protein|nr:LemA family protein [Akkermansiaceae bacterium]MDP4781018.1 LemA family protein [Akkermansiaceae bacterium]MDP4899026.1 LemA family protein [Akkermansiaceae bacterium]